MAPILLDVLRSYTDTRFKTELYKVLWRLYPGGLSYHVNYYMNGYDPANICGIVVESDFESAIINFIGEVLISPTFQLIVKNFNDKLKNTEEFKNCWTNVVINNPYQLRIGGEWMHDIVIKELGFTTKIQQLDFFKNHLTKSFNNPEITSDSIDDLTLYRGIVGMDIQADLQKLLHPRAFSSTSTDISTAITHAVDPEASITRYQQSDVIVILEIHLPSDMKYIDYNKLHPGDIINEWQKEIILPPGLTFEKREINNVDGFDVLVVDVVNRSGGTSFGKTTKNKLTLKQINVLIKLLKNY